MAASDLADMVADTVEATPADAVVEVAGPEAIGLDELVRRVLSATNDPRTVVTDDSARYFGALLDDASLTPGQGARIGPTRLNDRPQPALKRRRIQDERLARWTDGRPRPGQFRSASVMPRGHGRQPLRGSSTEGRRWTGGVWRPRTRRLISSTKTREAHREVDVALRDVDVEAVGDQRHPDQQQEAQGQHLDRRVRLDEARRTGPTRRASPRPR